MSSFVADKIAMDGLTFDDVLLIPAYSEVLPKTVELKTKFSRNIDLNVPFVTAAMDTVTESANSMMVLSSGVAAPRSHLDTAAKVTPSASASFSCVQFLARRRAEIRLPINL